ncbi:glycosyltransferase [Luteimonas soli]|uniref:Glycosyltransferase n=1 Tax=Luteimonas soli TaxID=1648966 RepID=A0ABV7XGC6_9GAMM
MGPRQDIKAVLASGLFDVQWYRQRHPGVPAAPSAAAGHFLEHALDPGHDPGPGFSMRRYLDANPDVAAAGMNPLLHYLRHGREEGRQRTPVEEGRIVEEPDLPGASQYVSDLEVLRRCRLFDSDFYLDGNSDVRAAGVDPLVHYVRHGAFEGRWPNPWFDGRGYAARYQDRADAMNPLAHYAIQGRDAPSWTSDRFDGDFYLARHADAGESGTTPLEHFLVHGVDQGRKGAPGSGLHDRLPRIMDCRTVRTTILMAVHDAHEHVVACLDSVLRNTELGGADSLLVIDDASTGPDIGSLLESLTGMPGVRVVRNAENMGYTRTINLGCGIAASEDVVLLNSDTVVGPHWLRNLKTSAYAGERTGTVTAVSDNAGAFSVPWSGESRVPGSIGVDDWARAVADVGAPAFEVPTGNGFCMYIRRAMLEDVGLFDEQAFPVGYGEENDLCMRAVEAGWHHMVDPAVFVQHARSASFGSRREELARAGAEQLESRHPTYPAAAGAIPQLPEFVLARYRIARRFRAIEGGESPPKPRILFVISTRIGGVPQTNADLMRGLESFYDSLALRCDRREVEVLRLGPEGYETLDRYLLHAPIDFATHVSGEYEAIVRALLVRHSIDLVHVRHLAWHSLNLPDVARGLGIPVVHSFHDYYTVCPTVNLIDRKGRYHPRGVADDAENALWPDDLLAPAMTPALLAHWQRRTQRALAPCDAFVASSASARRLLMDALPTLAERKEDFHIVPHGRDFNRFASCADMADVPPDGALRVLLPGNIGLHKGAGLLVAISQLEPRDALQLHLVGTAGEELTERVIDHGVYRREQFVERVEAVRPHLAALLSIAPETWCHTLTECWAAGIPVLAIDRGAVADRIREHGGGWLVEDDPASIHAMLLRLRADPAERRAKAAEARQWQQGEGHDNNVAAMARRYRQIYQVVLQRHRAILPAGWHGRASSAKLA